MAALGAASGRADMEEPWFALRLDARGNVVLLIGDDHVHLGPKESACAELRRFLNEATAWSGVGAKPN